MMQSNLALGHWFNKMWFSAEESKKTIEMSIDGSVTVEDRETGLRLALHS